MLKIGILFEDKAFANELLEMLSKVLFQYTEWEKECYHTCNEVLYEIETGKYNCNLLFMDIVYQSGSGLEIAEQIRKQHVDTDIIFITDSQEHVFECYRYHTFAYLLKPLKETEVELEIKRYLEEMQLNEKCLNITVWGNVIRIPLNSILYIESNYRKLVVHTTNNDYEYYEKMKTLEDLLKNDGFVRCHQSYLVPRNKISAYSGRILLIGDIQIPISRKYMECLKEQLPPEDRTTITEEKNCYLTSSLAQNQNNMGALVCIKGAYLGSIVRIMPEQKILIGRDETLADMIVNLPLVSRTHCAIIYHAERKEYEIVDFSSNGTFVNGDKRLVQDESYLLKEGSTISFGDRQTIYKLG